MDSSRDRSIWERPRARAWIGLMIGVMCAWALLTEFRIGWLRQKAMVATHASRGIPREEVEYRLGPPLSVSRYTTASGRTGQKLRYTYRLLGLPMDTYYVLLDEEGEVWSVYEPWGGMASIRDG